jgi:putative transposase
MHVLALVFVLFLLFAVVVFLHWQRVNKRFTRRLKRKEVPAQQHRFNPKPQWVIDTIIRLKSLMPNEGVRTIASFASYAFNRIHGNRETVGKSFVANVILKHHYAIVMQRRDMRNRKPVAIAANATWGLDLCGKHDDAGVIHPILGIVDHGSRVAITLNPIANMNFYTLAGQVLIAIGRNGKPTAIRTDNAPQLVSKRFRWFMKVINIRHQRSDVGCEFGK